LKQVFEITDKEIINQVLDKAEYGTLALCYDNRPYSLPINFVRIENILYFHGSLKGKKIEILNANPYVSFSVVEAYSMIQSYFSSKDNLACSATQFFKSVIIDGEVEFVKNYDEKVLALSKLMEKLQPEGRYKDLSDNDYQKVINATAIFKLESKNLKAKFKFGQNLNKDRFEMIIKYLEDRGQEVDMATIKLMKSFKGL
jgi:nitroimidazol reductase NimA-like FMN-containing flavoprotein (pyridoxamine 5'-phosphate oxidase superfamily)